MMMGLDPQLQRMDESSPLVSNVHNNERKGKSRCVERVCMAFLIASTMAVTVFILLYVAGIIRVAHSEDSMWKIHIETGAPDDTRGDQFNCFDSQSVVYRFVNETKIEHVLLGDITKNDLIMSSLNGEFSKVLFDLYDNYNNSIKMNKICFDNDLNLHSCLILGNNHLIFVNGIEINNLVSTKDVKIGDEVYDITDPIPVCVMLKIQPCTKNSISQNLCIVCLFFSAFVFVWA